MIQKTFIVDDFVMVDNKKFALNLNVYRNSDYFSLNKAKKAFKEQLFYSYPELKKIKANNIIVEYFIERNDNRIFDTMNIISVVDKFTLDALVDFGCLPNDSYRQVKYKAPIVSSEIMKMANKRIHIFCEFF